MSLHSIIMIIIGIVIGILISSLIIKKRESTGTLKIDHSNSEKDIFRFDIDEIDNLYHKNIIILKIDHNADLSQK